MGEVITLRPRREPPSPSTLRAVLDDTADLLRTLKGADAAEQAQISAQVEAIEQVILA